MSRRSIDQTQRVLIIISNQYLIGVVGDSSKQGDVNGELPVRYPDFPFPLESDGESDDESDSGDLNAGECDSVTVDPPPPPPR
jgi:hypothetical protein